MNIVELTNQEMLTIKRLINNQLKSYECVRNTCPKFNLNPDICDDAISYLKELEIKFTLVTVDNC